jgi:hypothetical protein
MVEANLSRRRFALTAGLGAAAAVAHPDIGLAFPSHIAADPLALWARLRGNPSGRKRLFTFSGEVHALDPSGRMRALARIEGHSQIKLRPLVAGWHVSQTDDLRLLDLKTGAALGAFTNPLTGGAVLPEPLRIRAEYVVENAEGVAVRRIGDMLTVEEQHPFAGSHEAASQVLTFTVATSLPDPLKVVATRVVRTLAWPTWMRMPHAGSPCLVLASMTSSSAGYPPEISSDIRE